MKNSARQAVQKPPVGYSAEAAGLWAECVEEWEFDPAALAIFDTGMRSGLMRMREAQALIKRDGLVLIDRFGQKKLNPAATVERDAAAIFLKAMRQLNLDLEPLRDRPGRPAGGEGA